MLLRSIVIVSFALCIAETEDKQNRTGKYLVFPPADTITTPAVGIFVAIALPLHHRQDVFLSYNFEFNYDLPENYTAVNEMLPLTWESNKPQDWQDFLMRRRRRSLTRKAAYLAIENNLKNIGISGRACLLRTICEAAEMPLHHNGLLGDVMHIFLLPSTTRDEGLPPAFSLAEQAGYEGDCSYYTKKCPFGILDLISTVF